MKCILCDKKEPFELIDELEFELAGEPTFIRPVMCGGCGLVFLHPPTEQDLLYEYYAAQARYLSETVAYDEQVEMIAGHFKKGAVLDIGSYDGRLLATLSDVFPDKITIHGVEPDKTVETIVDYVRWQDFHTVYLLGLEFDLITMGHVLEHLSDPMEVLEMCRAILSRKGLLFIEVPDLHRPQIQLEPYWTAQHLWYFSENTLKNILARAGFETINTQLTDYGAIRVVAQPGDGTSIVVDPNQTRETIEAYRHAHLMELGRIGEIFSHVQGRVAAFGAGEHTRWLAKIFPIMWDAVELVLDSNPAKKGMPFMGHHVIPVAMLPDYIDSVIISSYDTQDEMVEIIGRRAVRLYEPGAVKAYDTWGTA